MKIQGENKPGSALEMFRVSPSGRSAIMDRNRFEFPVVQWTMQVLSVAGKGITPAVQESLRVMGEGGVIAYPTESFYALGVNALDESAVKRLLHLKKRPREKAIPVVVGSPEILKTIVKTIPSGAKKFMEKFWPGPLTLVFDAEEVVPGLLLASRGKIAVRVPGVSFALHLAQAAPFPVTATSANISGGQPSRKAGEVMACFGGEIALVVDGGETGGGRPSTILDITVDPPRLLREGSISLDELSALR